MMCTTDDATISPSATFGEPLRHSVPPSVVESSVRQDDRVTDAADAAAPDPAALTPDRSQAYAILTVPRLPLRVPVAEGVGKRSVLN